MSYGLGWGTCTQLTESTRRCNLCLSQALSVAYVYYCALYHSSMRETCTHLCPAARAAGVLMT